MGDRKGSKSKRGQQDGETEMWRVKERGIQRHIEKEYPLCAEHSQSARQLDLPNNIKELKPS